MDQYSFCKHTGLRGRTRQRINGAAFRADNCCVAKTVAESNDALIAG